MFQTDEHKRFSYGQAWLEMNRHYVQMTEEDLMKAYRKHGPMENGGRKKSKDKNTKGSGKNYSQLAWIESKG